MTSRFKAILFDFDGLLFNSEPSWDKAYDLFLDKHKLTDQPGLHPKMHGMGLEGAVQLLMDNLGLKGDLDELVADFREVFYRVFAAEKDVLMSGAVDLLKQIKEKGKTASLNSGGHTRAKLVEMLTQNGVFDYFSLIISSDDVNEGKPAPDIYLESLRRLKLKADDCMALEDSVNGILSAKGAGLAVYGINEEDKIREDLMKAGANEVYSSLAEIKL